MISATSMRRLPKSLIPLLSVIIGGLAGSGSFGLVAASCAMAALVIAVFPLAGTIGFLGAKPAIDCLWNQKIGLGASVALNLQSILGVVLPIAIACVLAVRRSLPRPSGIEISLGLYCALSLIGILNSPAKAAAVGDFARIASPLAFLWVGRVMGDIHWRPMTVCWVLATYGLIPAFSAALQFAGLVTPVSGAVGNPTDVYRVTGFYDHPLEIAMRCSVALPFALLLCLRLRDRTVRVGMRIWAGVLLIASMATLVRSALAASLALVVSWLWMSRKRTAALAVLASITISCVAVSPIRRVLTNAALPLSEGNVYELGTGRGLLFAAQVIAFQQATVSEKLLGRGLHSAPTVNYRFAPTTAIDPGIVDVEEGNVGAHDQYLRVLTESGVLGLLAIVSALVLSIQQCNRVRKLRNDTIASGFATATVAMLVAILTFGISAVPFDAPGISWPIWLAIGYVTGLGGTGQASAVRVWDKAPQP